jgi:hypothetical protein
VTLADLTARAATVRGFTWQNPDGSVHFVVDTCDASIPARACDLYRAAWPHLKPRMVTVEIRIVEEE